MSDVTWFGGFYLAMTAFTLLYAASQIGEPRDPRTFGEWLCGLVINGLIIWGLFTVGVTS